MPGWDFQLQKGMNRLLTSMEPCTSWWRHNYNFTETGQHTSLLLHANRWAHLAIPGLEPAAAEVEFEGEAATGQAELMALKKKAKHGPGIPRTARQERMKEDGANFVEQELELIAEYQTLRRMPQTRFILFTVRTLISPFAGLRHAPAAAQAMAAALRRKCKLQQLFFLCIPLYLHRADP